MQGIGRVLMASRNSWWLGPAWRYHTPNKIPFGEDADKALVVTDHDRADAALGHDDCCFLHSPFGREDRKLLAGHDIGNDATAHAFLLSL